MTLKRAVLILSIVLIILGFALAAYGYLFPGHLPAWLIRLLLILGSLGPLARGVSAVFQLLTGKTIPEMWQATKREADRDARHQPPRPPDELVKQEAEIQVAIKVFISYSYSDRDFVDRLVGDLTAYGVNTWLDRFEIKVGDSLTRKVSMGIHEAGYLAVVLSPHSVRSEWVQRELNAGLMKELTLKRVFLLPILKAPCDIPALIVDKRWADFRESYDQGLQELLACVVPEGAQHCEFRPETVLIPEGEFIMGSNEQEREAASLGLPR